MENSQDPNDSVDTEDNLEEEEKEVEDNEEPKKKKSFEYEFFEPEESAEVCSKKKADMRAKFEINQINRGRCPSTPKYGSGNQKKKKPEDESGM